MGDVELRVTLDQASQLRAALLRVKASMSHAERILPEGQALDALLNVVETSGARPAAPAIGEILYVAGEARAEYWLPEPPVYIDAAELVTFLDWLDPALTLIELVDREGRVIMVFLREPDGWERLHIPLQQDDIIKPARRPSRPLPVRLRLFHAATGSRTRGIAR